MPWSAGKQHSSMPAPPTARPTRGPQCSLSPRHFLNPYPSPCSSPHSAPQTRQETRDPGPPEEQPRAPAAPDTNSSSAGQNISHQRGRKKRGAEGRWPVPGPAGQRCTEPSPSRPVPSRPAGQLPALPLSPVSGNTRRGCGAARRAPARPGRGSAPACRRRGPRRDPRPGTARCRAPGAAPPSPANGTGRHRAESDTRVEPDEAPRWPRSPGRPVPPPARRSLTASSISPLSPLSPRP